MLFQTVNVRLRNTAVLVWGWIVQFVPLYLFCLDGNNNLAGVGFVIAELVSLSGQFWCWIFGDFLFNVQTVFFCYFGPGGFRGSESGHCFQ